MEPNPEAPSFTVAEAAAHAATAGEPGCSLRDFLLEDWEGDPTVNSAKLIHTLHSRSLLSFQSPSHLLGWELRALGGHTAEPTVGHEGGGQAGASLLFPLLPSSPRIYASPAFSFHISEMGPESTLHIWWR